MSALGQKQTSRLLEGMSALPPKADIGTQTWNVRFVPKADISAQTDCHDFRAISSTGAMRPVDTFSIIFRTKSGVFPPIKR